MATSATDIDQLTINTIRTLSMDAVQAANSGHPGTPMALAPLTYLLWHQFLRYDPECPLWPARDRFVLSCGHASMLLYSMLHLAGVKNVDKAGAALDELAVPLEQIKQFRQLKSVCPGHPEFGETAGVETTTGPLGQGVGNSVGMAMAAKWLAAQFDKPDFELFGFNVYAVCSDGDLMEGIGCEAASLAGHLKLDNLCWIYDDNRITIEGATELAFSEDVKKRFEGLGWSVSVVSDANELNELSAAYKSFQRTKDQPTLIIVRSRIAFGAPNKEGHHSAHGAALGEEEVGLTKAVYGWPPNEHFLVPDEVLRHFRDSLVERGGESRRQWEARFSEYKREFPRLAKQFESMQTRDLPAGWDENLPRFDADTKGLASRVSSGKVLNAAAESVPWLVGGSADLAPSTMTLLNIDGATDFAAGSYHGRNFHFGVREHAMAAAVNGMTLCGLRAYGSTFFVFSDYLRPAMRLAAIMRIPSLFIFTHDSIGVGEDGPTHQPIEHLAAARAIPNLVTFRPADANEAVAMWRALLPIKDRPSAMILSRQNLPTIDRKKYASADGAMRGGYVLADCQGGMPDVILLSSGSEVFLTLQAHEMLCKKQVRSRVVSLPSWELFNEQDEAYRHSVLPPQVTARVAVEAGVRQGWEEYVGARGHFVGMDHYGASAPGAVLYKEFGFTPERIVDEAISAVA